MKKAILGITIGIVLSSTNVYANDNNNTYNYGDLTGSAVFNNKNNTEINVNGNVSGSVAIYGDKVTVIERGEKGETGANGKDGKDGLNGKDGKDGLNGKDGKDGLNGKDGKDGLNGKDGKDGLDGKDGKDGLNGKDGKDGLDGKDGKDGKDADMTIVNNKVDKSDYDVDQKRHEENLNTLKDGIETWNNWASHDSKEQWDSIIDLEDNKANKKDLESETQTRVNENKKLHEKIDNSIENQSSRDNEQDILISNKVDKSTFENESTLMKDVIDTKVDKSSFEGEITDIKKRNNEIQNNIDKNKNEQDLINKNQNVSIKNNTNAIEVEREERKQSISSVNTKLNNHESRIESNTQRINTVEKRTNEFMHSTNKRFSEMNKKIDENRKISSAGIASSGAMANIPQLSKYGDFSIGAGVGGYDGQEAIAVGFSARISENVSTKASVSTNTQSEVLWGAGVGIEW
ncbi:YadA-like family protein [Salmonella enterica]|nr:YadA-like family protein [Salmonella enterica]EME3782876.1 YadA-like family protein [Salmonella enterica]